MARIKTVRRKSLKEVLADVQEQRETWRKAYNAEREVVREHLESTAKLKTELEGAKAVITQMTNNKFADDKREMDLREAIYKRLRNQKEYVRIALGIVQRARKNKRKARLVRQACAVLEAAVDEEAEHAALALDGPLLRAVAIGGIGLLACFAAYAFEGRKPP